MQNAELILKYLQAILAAFLSPQVVVCATVIFALLLFRQPLKELIERLREGTAKFPGIELTMYQAERARREAAVPEGQQPEPTPAVSAADANIPKGLSEDQLRQIRDLITSEQMLARYWEFRYLNYFLAPFTQHVLDWFSSNPSITAALYDSILASQGIPIQERGAIIDALVEHHLIRIRPNQLIEVTPKGRDYVTWRGKMPAIGTSSSSPSFSPVPPSSSEIGSPSALPSESTSSAAGTDSPSSVVPPESPDLSQH